MEFFQKGVSLFGEVWQKGVSKMLTPQKKKINKRTNKHVHSVVGQKSVC